jgi:transcriptional regulator with XRE-family HTH domain
MKASLLIILHMAKTKDKSIGSIIKHYRILKGLTQEKLAESLSLSYQQVQKYEYNKTIPSLDKLIEISKALEIPIEAFFKDSLRNNLINKIEAEIGKNYEFIEILKESPELQEVIRFYAKHKSVFKGIDLVRLMSNLFNIPKEKKETYLNIIGKISLLIS